MDSITDIVKQLPTIMLYFVEGYIFVSTYKFIASKDKAIETKYLLLKSVVISFVIKTLFDCSCSLFGISFTSDSIYTLVLCALSVVLGYVCGKIVIAEWFHKVLFSLGVQRTPNQNIWDDVIGERQNCWVCLQSKQKENIKYLGLCSYIEDYEREPIFALKYYQVLNNKGEVVADYSDSDNVIVLNTKDFERIDIFYDKKFGVVSKVKQKLSKHDKEENQDDNCVFTKE